MRSRRFRLWLALALAFAGGLASCGINPQPGLPGSEDHSPSTPGVGKGGATMTGEGPLAGSTSSGGGLVLNPSGGASSGGSGPVLGLGGANESAGGEGPANEGGAGGAGPGDAGGVASDLPK